MYTCYYKTPGVVLDFIDDNMNTKDLVDFVHDIQEVVDKLSYVTVLHRIWLENTNKAQEYKIKNPAYFWEANKRMIDYASSVFNLREYIGHYSPDRKGSDVYKPFDLTYTKPGSWLKFICEYRNCLTHHSCVVKDYEGNSGELIINLNEFVEYEQSEYTFKSKPERKAFLDWLISFRDKMDLIGGFHYVRAPYVIKKANEEINDALDKTYDIIFRYYVQEKLDGLISLIHKEDKQYSDTYYESENDEVVFAPNQLLENYFISMVTNTMLKSTLSIHLTAFLKEKGYGQLFYYGRTVDDLLSEMKSKGY